MANILYGQDFKLRRYCESDLDSIEKLFASKYDEIQVPKRRLVFDWIARHNPAASDESCYLVIEDAKRIIAYQARMPVDLMIKGVKERGYFLHDTLVDMDYRKKGFGGLPLVNNLLRTWEN